MPYIKQEDRKKFFKAFEHLRDVKISNVGELNYILTSICNEYKEQNGLNYRVINDIIGVLECAKQEYYRRVASIYEGSKILENGDI
jgi:hypothetical protein